MIVIVLAFASSLSIFADDQTAAQQTAGAQVVTLTQLVEQALSAGPDVKTSVANLSLAQLQYTTSAARNAVTLNGNTAASHTAAQSGVPTVEGGRLVTGAPPEDAVQAGLSLSAPLSTTVGLSASHTITQTSPIDQSTSVRVSASSTLWDGYPGGSSLASVQQAALSLQGAQSSADSDRRNIVYQVKQAAYTLLAQQRQLAILRQTLVQRQEEMKKTQALFDVQSANQIDLKQAQINQTQANLDLLQAQDNIEIAREKLSALVGWPIDKQYSIAETDDLPVPDLDVAAAVKTALSQRVDLKQLALNLASGEISVALARAKGSPTVSVSGGVSVTEDWTTSTDNTSWNAGLQVSMPILDAGAAAAAVQQAQTNYQLTRIQQDQLAASIATSVKDAIYSLRDLLARSDLAQANLELAQDQYDLTKLQFDSGVSSNLDVLGASVALTTAQVNRAKARADAQLGVLALQNAMGN